MNRLLLGCILLAVSWTAWADDTTTTITTTLYKVEVIVFENLDPNALQAEDWPTDPGTPSLDNAMELDTLPEPIPPEAETLPDADGAPAADEAATPADTTATNADMPALSALPAGDEAPTPDTAPAAIADANAAVTPAEPAAPVPTWRWMADSELSLSDDEQKLIDSGHYRPMLHIGWVQPLDSSDQGTPVHLYDGLKPKEQLPADASLETDAIEKQQSQVNPLTPPADEPALSATPPVEIPAPPGTGGPSPTPEETVQQAQSPHILDGTFTLSKGRFLHVDVDLDYRLVDIPPPPPVDATTEVTTQDSATGLPATRYVRMVQSRRIRGDELHYLDHPLFGVLFVVSPLPETPEDAMPADPKN